MPLSFKLNKNNTINYWKTLQYILYDLPNQQTAIKWALRSVANILINVKSDNFVGFCCYWALENQIYFTFAIKYNSYSSAQVFGHHASVSGHHAQVFDYRA